MTIYSNVPENKIARVGRRTYIESSINFANNNVTLDKRKHKKLYDNELLSCCDPDSAHVVDDVELDKCAQCGLPVSGSYTGRTDLLCDYHAEQ